MKRSGAATYLDGYLSDIYFVDGQALTPSDFAEEDTNGVWVPKAYSGTYGNNGFHLDFSDGTSTTTLGYDAAGSNDWTCNNVSLTAGVTYDWMEDTPTNNYCVLNAVDNITGTVARAGLQYNEAAAGDAIRGSIAPTTGKWYFEADYTASGTVDGSAIIGVQLSDQPLDTSVSVATVASGTWVYRDDGLSITGGVSTGGFTNFNTGARIMVAVDLDSDKLWFGYNGTWEKSGSPSAGTGEHYSLSAYSGREIAPFCGFQSATGTSSWDVNFGQLPFTYTPPTGFKALCTANLPAVSIKKPKSHFDVKTYTGNASTQAITGLGFTPGLVWMKSRGRAVDHAFYDQVRGVEKRLESNNTDAEVTGDTTGLTAFNSDGWTMGALDQINGTTATNSFVGWAWKANGAGASNTDGSITSSVSANTTADFSIVTYTGTGANATVGHGLGVVPKLIIVKQRSSGTTENWAVYHASLANTEYVLLNTTAAKATGATYWNSTTPTSTVFSLGSAADTNESAKDFVAYCFAEVPGYSKFGSYTGNGSTGGAFVWCGFRPKYVLVKSSTTTDDWRIYDALRPGYNVLGGDSRANSSAAEATAAEIDFTANGFKLRVTTTPNAAQTYVFAAFAEHPFGGSNVAPAPAR